MLSIKLPINLNKLKQKKSPLKFLAIIILLGLSLSAQALNVTIIESTSVISGHTMDSQWNTVLTNMGHTPTIAPQTTLDNNTFFASADILIVSSGTIALPANRIATILQFLQTGKPVFIQSEYLASFTTNQAFASLVSSLGGTFNWTNNFVGTLNPMNATGLHATNPNTISPLTYYWYSVAGIGDCNTVNFLSYGNEYHGFQFVPPNPSWGTIATTTDQDWVRQGTSLLLMENIITQLITPPTTIGSNLFVNLGNDTVICTGQNLNFLLNPNAANVSYLWQDNSTNPTFTVTQPGTYWVTISDSCGSATDTIVVSSMPLSTPVNLGNDTLICTGQNLLLDVTTTNATYLWQNNSTNPTLTITQPGTYWVTVSDSCGSSSDTIVIGNVPFNATVNLGNDTVICQGSNLQLNATTSNVTYLWQDNSTNPTLTVTQAGTYWVTISDSCNSMSDTINISVLPTSLPVNLGNDTLLCSGQSFMLDATTANATSYLWQNSSSNPMFTINQAGTYWVTASNLCGSSTDTIIVGNTPRAVPINLGNDTVLCTGQSMILDATTNNAIGYLWQNTSSNPLFTVTQAGIYTVQIIDECGSIFDTINVSYESLPNVYLGEDTTLCLGESIVLNPNVQNASYSWQDNSTAALYTVTTQGSYYVTAQNKCGMDSDTINISTHPIPNLELSDTTICYGESITIDATSPGVSYLWNDNSTAPVRDFNQAGQYIVDLTNICGTYTFDFNLDFENCTCDIFIPNAFTPNADGLNDYFSPIQACPVLNYRFSIFNRWGENIFTTTLPTDKWDGTYKRQNVPLGVYFYTVKYIEEISKKEKIVSGDVTVIR